MLDLTNELRILILSLVYAFVGMAVLYVGYRIFDMLTPTDTQQKIFEEGNVAVGILVGAFIVGLAIIIAAAITG